jgi:hypothetical protein
MNSSGRPEPSFRELIWSAPSVASTTARMRSSLTPTSGQSKYTSRIFAGNSKTMPTHRVGCRRSAERATGWQTPKFRPFNVTANPRNSTQGTRLAKVPALKFPYSGRAMDINHRCDRRSKTWIALPYGSLQGLCETCQP